MSMLRGAGTLVELLNGLRRREDGQDLIEYALLTATIGFAGAVAFALLSTNVNDAYSSWDAGVNDLWVPPEPE